MSAVFVAVASTSTAPVVLTLPVEVTHASVERPLSARPTVRPIAIPPTLTFTVCACAVCVPSALTVTPPAPTMPWAPDFALTLPSRSANARAPLNAAAPTPTATARMSFRTMSVAVTLMLLTGPVTATATLPMLAVASPLTFTTATPAPTLTAPIWTPIA